MKVKIYLTYFAISIGLFSCEGPIREKVFEKYFVIQGMWKLSSMDYTDENGIRQSITSSETTIAFNGNLNRNTDGKIVTLSNEFDFSYNFGLEKFSIDVVKSQDLPIDSPGRSNTFDIKFYQNRFEIFTEVEFLRSHNKAFRDVTYRFERL